MSVVKTHRTSDFVHRGSSNLPRTGRTSIQNIPGEARIVLVFFPALLHWSENFDQSIGGPTLTLDAPDPSRPATLIYVRDCVFVAKYFVQIAHGTDIRISRISAPHPGWISHHRLQLQPDYWLGIRQQNRIAVGLRHLAAVCAGKARGWGEQGRRFRENGPTLPRVKAVKPSRNLSRQLDVRYLVLAYRHDVRLIDQYIGRLQDWITQKTIGTQVLFQDV